MEYRTIDDGRNHRREMLVDGELVCWLGVIDYTMRIGAAQVRMAGIAGVETKEQHRKKGYMRHFFNDTLAYMQTEGYDVSMLFGIPDFYPKFGYATCLAEPSFTLKTRIAETASMGAPKFTTRPITPADLPDVIALYERNNATRACSLVRTPEYFTGFKKGSNWWRKAESTVILDDAGQFAGYIVWDKHDDEVIAIEIECVADAFYPSVLAEFARLAIEKRAGLITFHMPLDHPFAIFAQRYGARWTAQYPIDARGMLRIMNQATLFDKLIPMLHQRASALEPYTITLRTDIGETTLSHGQAAHSVCAISLPQSRLMQLICGYRNARDVLNDSGVTAQGDVLPLLDAVFPAGHAYTWVTDEF